MALNNVYVNIGGADLPVVDVIGLKHEVYTVTVTQSPNFSATPKRFVCSNDELVNQMNEIQSLPGYKKAVLKPNVDWREY